jgi:hypothetical protein
VVSLTKSWILVFAGTITAFMVVLAPAQESKAPARPSNNPSVEELIKRLNSDKYKTREAATRALLKRTDALPA